MLDTIARFAFVDIVEGRRLAVGFGRREPLDAVEVQRLAGRIDIVAIVGDHRPNAKPSTSQLGRDRGA